MDQKEMRELDAWIFMNLFWNGSTYEGEIPCYTTNTAAAMDVLMKCSELLSGACVFIKKTRNGWFVYCSGEKTKPEPTIELAICLFAKKFFTKK